MYTAVLSANAYEQHQGGAERTGLRNMAASPSWKSFWILRALGVFSKASAIVMRVTVGRGRIVVQDGKCLLRP
jgi:hypothetical protein